MAYDIYGNDLRRGYCEVHPHVNQEYPCDLCCVNNKKEQERNYNKEMQNQYYNDLEKHHSVRVLIDTNVVRIIKDVLDQNNSLDIDFNGSYMIQIQKENDIWKVTNAMNGYGENCFEQFKNEKVIIIENEPFNPTNK